MSRWENSHIGKMGSVYAESLARLYPELIRVVKGGNLPQSRKLLGYDAKYGVVNTYHSEVLKEVIG